GAALISYLEGHELLPRFRPMTHVHVLLVGDVHEKARKVVQELRDNGVNVAVDLSGQPVEEQLKTATIKDVPYTVRIGERELADGLFEIKNLASGKPERHSLARIISILKDHRR